MGEKSIPSRILDLLETDGGWLTVAGIAMELNANEESVDRALYRLRQRGQVQHRDVELARSGRTNHTAYGSSTGSGSAEHRREWSV